MKSPAGSFSSYVLRVIGLAAVYYIAARLGLRYASIGDSISLVWPPTGLALAALAILGYRYWPGVAIGAFLANAATPVPLLVAGAIAAGNTLEALVGSHLLLRMTGSDPRFEQLRHVRAFILVAAPLAALVSASVGITALWLSGRMGAGTISPAFVVWWVGDLLGALVMAPVILSWAGRPIAGIRTRRILEMAVIFTGTVLTAELGVTHFLHFPVLRQIDYPYLLFPFVIWAAVRFGSRGASLMTLTVAVVTIWHTVERQGPFVATSPEATLFAVACYLSVVAITGMALAGAVEWERSHATAELRASEQRLRHALDAARMGTWSWSVETNTLSWDDTLRRLYGLSQSDRIEGYDDFIQRVHPSDREFVAQAVRRCLEQGGDLNYEFRIVLPNGQARWIADQGEVRRNAHGRVIAMTGVCMDVTQRKVSEEQLRHAHRMESVGRLAGGVAHEANNQMSVVLGAASFILMRSDVSDAVRADVEHIQRAAERTAAVTAQLLAFSRRQVMRPQVLDLNLVVQRWDPVLRRIMGEDCTVELRLGKDIGMIRADPGQLEQVLLNLALNARDAMPRGGRLTVETTLTVLSSDYIRLKPEVAIRPGPFVMLVVTDSGHGMDAQTLEHIFEPFFITKGIGRGTGLGLSTVYGIVKQSEGFIWGYSEPGQGTAFKLYFPVSTDASVPVPLGKPEAPPAQGERILVVEDEPAVRAIVTRSLRDAGYEVVQAAGGKEALETLEQATEPFQLVITDVVMPGMNGRELAHELQKRTPGIPILFTSGYTDGEIERRGLLDPGASFIQKPYAPETIIRIVRERLDAHARG